MKRLILTICLLSIISGPVAEREVTEKDLHPLRQWKLTKVYYRHVDLPDGSRPELKSRVPLTERQWLDLAKKVYEVNKEEPVPTIKVTCPKCGEVFKVEL